MGPSGQDDEHSGEGHRPRRKPFDDARDAAQDGVATAYRDAEVGALVTAGKVEDARQHLFRRLRDAGEDAAIFEDLIRLEHGHGGAWQSWVMRGLATSPDLAPRLLRLLPEDDLTTCAVRQALPWNALRGQRDAGAAHRLFALRVGALLWQGQVEDAFAAVIEPALRERAEHDADARALLVAVLAAFGWRDAERVRQAAPMLGVSLPEPEPDALPPYPLDALEHAVLLGEALRRARQRADCPEELARAIELGPFFGGRYARALLDELGAALRARPDEALRFCDAVVDSSSALALYVAHAIAELGYETHGAEAAPDERARQVIEGLARSERRRRGAAAIAASASVASAAAFALQNRFDLMLGVATPPALFAWALVGFLREVSYAPRMRPALARALVQERGGALELRRALDARSELAWVAARAARDEGLALLAALSARRAQ